MALNLMGATGFAESITMSQKVDIRAVVPPMQYIVINQDGQILEIGSNSNQAVQPQVYVGKVAQANQIDLSSEVYQRYSHLLDSQKLHAGVLYKKPPQVSVIQNYRIKILNTSSI